MILSAKTLIGFLFGLCCAFFIIKSMFLTAMLFLFLNFINVKKESENKIQTELNNIILNSKNKIDYIVKKLPNFCICM